MSDDECERLLSAAPDRRLDRLPIDVWRGVRRAEAARRTRLAGAYQIGALALAVAIGLTTGAGLGYSADRTPADGALLPGGRLAPSALLLGGAE